MDFGPAKKKTKKKNYEKEKIWYNNYITISMLVKLWQLHFRSYSTVTPYSNHPIVTFYSNHPIVTLWVTNKSVRLQKKKVSRKWHSCHQQDLKSNKKTETKQRLINISKFETKKFL